LTTTGTLPSWDGPACGSSLTGVLPPVQAKLFKGKENLKFTVNDLFKTSAYHFTNGFGIINVDGRIDFNADRWFNTNFTYNFGNNQVKKTRRRDTGSEDERKRLGGEG
jgi:hypothetical protein